MKNYFFAIALLICTQLTAQNIKRPDSYYFNRGLECLNEGKNRDAYDYFLNELSDNPNNGYAHTWTGYILLNAELYGDALASLEKAEKHVPKKDKEFVALVYALQGEAYNYLEDYDKALACYGKAIKANPNDIDLLDSRGQLYFDLKQYDQSDKDYEKIIELDPSGVIGYMGKGRNSLRQDRFDEAIRLFDHVAKLHGKDYSSCYSFRAEAYAGLKQYDKAADDIITAMVMNRDDKAFYLMTTTMAESAALIMTSKLKIQQLKEPNMAIWPYCLGVVYEESKNYPKAIENYKKANSLDTAKETSFRIACCYNELCNFMEAIKHVNDALQMDPTNIIYKITKSELEYHAGLSHEALMDINECITETPDYFYPYYEKAFFENNLNLTDEAIEDYSIAIMLNPDYSYSYLGRGDMYLRKGQKELAMNDFRKIIEIDTIPSVNTAPVAYALLALGEKEKASNYMERLIDSYPESSGVYYEATCLNARMGDVNKALDNLEMALKKGYLHFAHFANDDDLDILRSTKRYQDLLQRYKSTDNGSESSLELELLPIVVEIPFIKANGVTEVQCIINGLPLHFVFDTGASDVTMSMVEATFMLKNKYLSPLDIIGKQNYLTADGNVSEGTVINLKSVKIGDLELTNVRASVVKSQNAPLLLGQSVLGRLGKIEIDNEKRVIRVTGK